MANAAFSQGDLAAARAGYERAIELDPHAREAHEGLSYVLSREGDEAAAQIHRDAAFSGRPLRTHAFRGTAEPLAVLLVTSAKGGNVFTDFLLDDRTFLVHELTAEYAERGAALPEFRFAFNAVGDADRCGDALAAADQILARTAVKILNLPRAVTQTARAANARRLSQLEGVRAARVAPAIRSQGAPLEFPFLLRTPGHHTGRHFLMVSSASELQAAFDALPGEELLAIEYVETRSADGYFRKYRAMSIDGRLYPAHLAVSREWKVHYLHSETAGNPAFEREEHLFLSDMRAAIGAQAAQALDRVARELALDYGGIDFAVDSDGRLVVFEANATMILVPPALDRFAEQHQAATEAALAAARRMVLRAAAGNPA